MALNTNKSLKLYYSIKEVAQMFNVSESLLRYWETEFPMLSPKTTSNKVRQYSEADIKLIRNIHNLVKVRGFKISAARKMINKNPNAIDKGTEILNTLTSVRDELKELRKELDRIEYCSAMSGTNAPVRYLPVQSRQRHGFLSYITLC